jgi:hypothetical protein
MNHRLGIWYSLVFLAGPSWALAAPNPIEIQEPGTNLFAGQKIEHVIALRVPADFKGRLTWAFSSSSGLVFPRGRGEVEVVGKGAGPSIVKLLLETPEVKPGVVLEAKLELTLSGSGEATSTRKIHIYPTDPFVNRTQWLKDLGLVVFDSSDKSKTVDALEALKIPHERIKDVDKLGDRKEGVIIVAEGISFKEEPGLAETLVQLAQRGCKVVCLAAGEGSFTLPGIGANDNAPEALTFHRNGVIRQLDKRLDGNFWSSKGPLVSHTLHFTPEDGKVSAEIQANTKGWGWVEVESVAGGKLIFCQFALLRHWDASPTPRYLFARILESLTA